MNGEEDHMDRWRNERKRMITGQVSETDDNRVCDTNFVRGIQSFSFHYIFTIKIHCGIDSTNNCHPPLRKEREREKEME